MERKCKISVEAFNKIFPTELQEQMTPEEAHTVSMVELKVLADTIVSPEEIDELLVVIKNLDERLTEIRG